MERNKIKISILACSTVLMTPMTISAVLSDISKQYYYVTESVVQMVLTLPFLISTIFALLAGPFSASVPKKFLLFIGLVSGLSGGMIGLHFGKKSIELLLLSSALIGAGQGIVLTTSMALIADYFEGDNRQALMGLQSAFVNFGGMLIIFISGLMAGVDWKFSYTVYIVYIPILAFVMINLPWDYKSTNDNSFSSNEKDSLSKEVYFACFTVFIFGVFFYVFQTNIALLISELRLGSTTLGGLANTIMLAAGGVTGIIYRKIMRVFKDNIMIFGLIITSLGLLLIYLSGSIMTIVVSAIFCGLGMTCIIPATIFKASNSVKTSSSGIAIALVNSILNIGIFLSPIIINFISSTIINNKDITIKFLVSSVALLLLAGIIKLRSIKLNNKSIDNGIDPPVLG